MATAQTSDDRIERQFGAWDRDGNHELTKDEFHRGPRLFAVIDQDGNNAVTIEEINEYFAQNRENIAPANPNSEPSESIGEFADAMPLTIESCRRAASYSERATGHAVLVMLDGKIVYEKYTNGWNADTPHRLASGTKSFAGAVAVVAVEDGLLTLDEKVSDTLIKWKDDERLSKITIRDLLTLTSGIAPGENSQVLPYVQAIQTSAIDDPGNKFRYGPNAFQIFGAIIGSKLAEKNPGDSEDYLAYLRRRVLSRIDMTAKPWRRTPNGDPHVPSGAFVTAREWAKYGRMLCQGGIYDDEPVLDSEIIQELTKGSDVNPRYGVTFWLGVNEGTRVGDNRSRGLQGRRLNEIKIPEDMFMAAGAGKQRLYVIPSLDLVAVRMGETEGQRFRDDLFLKLLLNKE